ncbi:hypothetical protein TCAL_02037 [Tigriopus californicus]|uniref:ZP domain-containing protein n=1 Tax=Tigriopus californicus TaxID=6832 RepID=A0A553NBQ4_TIGCA|nr:uncharacterized protein LOC131889642 [Tigriopus californicus]TRY62871.1 hypothetical protein TCAL_02037 [Tigriopus californicus]|eukprot:TCALIF_02037-PA protein Name:"Similar to Tgfbr3 Transforming growth factor beta receptor type 3 (Rattus norvegicus)" AED:0.10 eAED:0.10 QI:401/1/1/1/1/1/4/3294/869
MGGLVLVRGTPTLRLMSIWLLLGAGLYSSGRAQDAPVEFCSAEAVLETKYVMPFYQAERAIAAHCVSAELSAQGHGVHVVRVAQTGRIVILTLEENERSARGVVLVLDSPTPVKWRLDFVSPVNRRAAGYSRTVILSAGSRVVSSNFPLETREMVDEDLDPSMRDPEFIEAIRSRFEALSSFVRLAQVNRISLVTHPAHPPDICQPQAGPSPAVHGQWISASKMRGCFHAELAGAMDSDVYIIDLESSGGPPSAALHIVPESEGTMTRNMTLVLRSGEPLVWLVEALAFRGRLTIITHLGSSVYNKSRLSFEQVEVKTKSLPAAMDDLWRSVISDTGISPMSYVKVARSDVITMKIPKKGSLSSFQPSNKANQEEEFKRARDSHPESENDLAQKTVLLKGSIVESAMVNEAEQSYIQHVVEEIRSGMTKQCSEVQTVLAIERDKADPHNVLQMSLNDPKCLAEKNETHWLIKTKSTSCGSLNVFSGSNPMFRNNVVLQFASQSRLFKKKVSIPFSCRIKPGINGHGQGVVERVGSSADTGRFSGSSDSDETTMEEMYSMIIERKARNGFELLVDHRDQMADVALGDELRVMTSFDTKSPLMLDIERCWISGNAQVDLTSVLKEQVLIWEGCPAESSVNVTMGSTHARQNPWFSFQVDESIMGFGEFYLFCLIGLCSPDPLFKTGNLGSCRDPSDQCSSRQRHESPVAQQLSRRGPLRMFPYLKDASFPQDLAGHDQDYLLEVISVQNQTQLKDSSSGLRSAQVLMVGVPTEIAVAIALASFVIGAALTGLLCCVHHRNYASKIMRIRRNETALKGNELQSMMDSSFPQPQTAGSANSTRNLDETEGHAPESVAFIPRDPTNHDRSKVRS